MFDIEEEKEEEKKEHADAGTNFKFFKSNYVDKELQKQPNVKCYHHDQIAWIVFSAPKREPIYNMGHPISIHQPFERFVEQCKKSFTQVNDYAWKEIEKLKKMKEYDAKKRASNKNSSPAEEDLLDGFEGI